MKELSPLEKKQDELINLLRTYIDEIVFDDIRYDVKQLESEIEKLKQEPDKGLTAEDDFESFLISKAIFTWSEIDLIVKLYNDYAAQQLKDK
jgi:hypothetical protein